MAVFSMDSDKYFIQQNILCTGVLVFEYCEPKNSCRYRSTKEYDRPSMSWLGNVSEVGFDHSWSGLEVFGVTFTGQSLAALVRDLSHLTITESDGQKTYFMVNRQDLCFKGVVGYNNNEISYERIYGIFSWSKYGVVNPSSQTKNGAVSVPRLAIMPANDEADEEVA